MRKYFLILLTISITLIQFVSLAQDESVDSKARLDYLDEVVTDDEADRLEEMPDGEFEITQEMLHEAASLDTPVLTGFEGNVFVASENSEEEQIDAALITLAYNTRIRCEDESVFEITYPDGTVIVSEGVTELKVKPGKIELIAGSVVTDYQGASGGFEIETKIGTISCRGTLFSAGVEGTDAGANLTVKVYEGKVSVTDEAGSFMVQAGNMVKGAGGQYEKSIISADEMALYVTLAQSAEAMAGDREGSEGNQPESNQSTDVQNPVPINNLPAENASPAGMKSPSARPAPAGIQGGMLNLDSTPTPSKTTESGEKIPAVAGETGAGNGADSANPVTSLTTAPGVTTLADRELANLMNMAATLTEAIDIIKRLRSRKLDKDADWKNGRDWIVIRKYKQTKGTWTKKPQIQAQVSNKLSLLYLALKTRESIMQRLLREDLQPFGSWNIQNLKNTYPDIVSGAKPPADRKEFLIKRIVELHDIHLMNELRKTDRRLASWKPELNPFSGFKALEKLIYKAEMLARLNTNRNKILNLLKKATRVRQKPNLRFDGRPPGLSDMEIAELNHAIERLKNFYGFGAAVPEGFKWEGLDENITRQCHEKMREILAALVKYTTDVNVRGVIDMRKMLKDGYITQEYRCPLEYPYALTVAPARDKSGDIKAVVRCPLHEYEVQIIRNTWTTNKKALSSMKKIFEATQKFISSKGVLVTPTVKELIEGGYLKPNELEGYPDDGVYTIAVTENKAAGKVLIEVSNTKYGAGVKEEVPVAKLLKETEKLKKQCLALHDSIFKATTDYLRAKEPSLDSPTMDNLISEKFLKKAIACPASGQFTISVKAEGTTVKITIECSIHGATEHSIDLSKLYR